MTEIYLQFECENYGLYGNAPVPAAPAVAAAPPPHNAKPRVPVPQHTSSNSGKLPAAVSVVVPVSCGECCSSSGSCRHSRSTASSSSAPCNGTHHTIRCKPCTNEVLHICSYIVSRAPLCALERRLTVRPGNACRRAVPQGTNVAPAAAQRDQHTHDGQHDAPGHYARHHHDAGAVE